MYRIIGFLILCLVGCGRSPVIPAKNVEKGPPSVLKTVTIESSILPTSSSKCLPHKHKKCSLPGNYIYKLTNTLNTCPASILEGKTLRTTAYQDFCWCGTYTYDINKVIGDLFLECTAFYDVDAKTIKYEVECFVYEESKNICEFSYESSHVSPSS